MQLLRLGLQRQYSFLLVLLSVSALGHQLPCASRIKANTRSNDVTGANYLDKQSVYAHQLASTLDPEHRRSVQPSKGDSN